MKAIKIFTLSLFIVLFFKGSLFSSHYPLYEIDFIDKEMVEKLKTIGIETTKDLFDILKNKRKFNAVIKKIKIKKYRLKKWIEFCDLLRIKGIGPKVARVLTLAGVKNSRILSRQEPEKLLKKIIRVNKKFEILGKIPDIDTVKDWIEQAKRIKKLKD